MFVNTGQIDLYKSKSSILGKEVCVVDQVSKFVEFKEYFLEEENEEEDNEEGDDNQPINYLKFVDPWCLGQVEELSSKVRYKVSNKSLELLYTRSIVDAIKQKKLRE